MSRTALALLAVAGLVVTAGCGAVIPGGDASPSDPGADLEPADPPYATPLENSSLLADHEAALRDAGTFTVVRTATMNNTNRQRYRATVRAHADLEDGRVYSTHRPEPVTQMYRYGNGTSYLRVVGEESRSYERNPPTNRSASSWARQSIETVVPLVDFEHAGATNSSGGERVHVYRATDTDRVNTSMLAPRAENAEATALNATIRVRASGLVTEVDLQFTLSLDDSERSYHSTTTFSELGDADASPPVWLDDARNATE